MESDQSNVSTDYPTGGTSRAALGGSGIFVQANEEPLLIWVDPMLRGRCTYMRSMTDEGAEISIDHTDEATQLLILHPSSERTFDQYCHPAWLPRSHQQRWARAVKAGAPEYWKRKVILKEGWVHACLQRGRFLGAVDNWGGFRAGGPPVSHVRRLKIVPTTLPTTAQPIRLASPNLGDGSTLPALSPSGTRKRKRDSDHGIPQDVVMEDQSVPLARSPPQSPVRDRNPGFQSEVTEFALRNDIVQSVQQERSYTGAVSSNKAGQLHVDEREDTAVGSSPEPLMESGAAAEDSLSTPAAATDPASAFVPGKELAGSDPVLMCDDAVTVVPGPAVQATRQGSVPSNPKSQDHRATDNGASSSASTIPIAAPDKERRDLFAGISFWMDNNSPSWKSIRQPILSAGGHLDKLKLSKIILLGIGPDPLPLPLQDPERNKKYADKGARFLTVAWAEKCLADQVVVSDKPYQFHGLPVFPAGFAQSGRSRVKALWKFYPNTAQSPPGSGPSSITANVPRAAAGPHATQPNIAVQVDRQCEIRPEVRLEDKDRIDDGLDEAPSASFELAPATSAGPEDASSSAAPVVTTHGSVARLTVHEIDAILTKVSAETWARRADMYAEFWRLHPEYTVAHWSNIFYEWKGRRGRFHGFDASHATPASTESTPGPVTASDAHESAQTRPVLTVTKPATAPSRIEFQPMEIAPMQVSAETQRIFDRPLELPSASQVSSVKVAASESQPAVIHGPGMRIPVEELDRIFTKHHRAVWKNGKSFEDVVQTIYLTSQVYSKSVWRNFYRDWRTGEGKFAGYGPTYEANLQAARSAAEVVPPPLTVSTSPTKDNDRTPAGSGLDNPEDSAARRDQRRWDEYDRFSNMLEPYRKSLDQGMSNTQAAMELREKYGLYTIGTWINYVSNWRRGLTVVHGKPLPPRPAPGSDAGSGARGAPGLSMRLGRARLGDDRSINSSSSERQAETSTRTARSSSRPDADESSRDQRILDEYEEFSLLFEPYRALLEEGMSRTRVAKELQSKYGRYQTGTWGVYLGHWMRGLNPKTGLPLPLRTSRSSPRASLGPAKAGPLPSDQYLAGSHEENGTAHVPLPTDLQLAEIFKQQYDDDRSGNKVAQAMAASNPAGKFEWYKYKYSMWRRNGLRGLPSHLRYSGPPPQKGGKRDGSGRRVPASEAPQPGTSRRIVTDTDSELPALAGAASAPASKGSDSATRSRMEGTSSVSSPNKRPKNMYTEDEEAAMAVYIQKRLQKEITVSQAEDWEAFAREHPARTVDAWMEHYRQYRARINQLVVKLGGAIPGKRRPGYTGGKKSRSWSAHDPRVGSGEQGGETDSDDEDDDDDDSEGSVVFVQRREREEHVGRGDVEVVEVLDSDSD